MSSPVSLPFEIYRSAQRGELQKVVKWLRKEGLVDALFPSTPCHGGLISTDTLMNTAAACGHLDMVRMLLKRGASVLANQPRLHRAHGCCAPWPPLHRARSAAALGQP
eukprot:scaffold31074_cov60-Phaeocystis_antarctica.AAC.2